MILDYLFITGQTASALLVLYGAFLILVPMRRQAAPAPTPTPKQEMLLAKY
jgi:hypothetical protein